MKIWFYIFAVFLFVSSYRARASSPLDPTWDSMMKWVLDHPNQNPSDAVMGWSAAHPKDAVRTSNGAPANPEQDEVFLVSHPEYDPSQKSCYLLIKMYFVSGHRDYAMRAAKKLIELKPKEGKAFEMVGFLLLADGRTAEAIQPLKTAYALGDEDAVILLTQAILLQDKPIDEYVDALQRLKLVDMDAYKPLLISIGIMKAAPARKAFLDRVLDGANFYELVKNDDIYTLLLRVYTLLGDQDGIKKTQECRAWVEANKMGEPTNSTK